MSLASPLCEVAQVQSSGKFAAVEQQDLCFGHRSAFLVAAFAISNSPEGSGDTVLPGNVGGLEEGGGPGPLRDDDGGGEAGLDHTSSS